MRAIPSADAHRQQYSSDCHDDEHLHNINTKEQQQQIRRRPAQRHRCRHNGRLLMSSVAYLLVLTLASRRSCCDAFSPASFAFSFSSSSIRTPTGMVRTATNRSHQPSQQQQQRKQRIDPLSNIRPSSSTTTSLNAAATMAMSFPFSSVLGRLKAKFRRSGNGVNGSIGADGIHSNFNNSLYITKRFFDEQEKLSGKDYSWITQAKPLSKRMINDIRRRKPHYVSDWVDGLRNKKKAIPAILFLYFACLAPAVSFGTIASQITNNSLGVVEFVMSAGASGMAYSIICGQPMAFIAPTGLTLAFISGLFRFCTLRGLPFFPVYSWVGIWTSLFLCLLGLGGSSQFIRFCTRFTDEIFNGLLSLNFIYEAVASLKRNFEHADPMNLTSPFISLAMALITFWTTMKATAFESSKYLSQQVRTTVKDFGPVTIFVFMSFVNTLPSLKKYAIQTLTVPDTFQLAAGRNFLIPINSIPLQVRMLCSLPAILLTSLFFMDQNISVRVVNNPDNKLKKGAAYNLDMVALGLITGAVSLLGLPWMCGATVQSMNHVRAMTETKFNPKTEEIEIVKVTETRLTGFLVHAFIFGTLGLLPLLRIVPIPVVSGVFLFLGRKLMSGNSFLQRMRDALVESERLADDHPLKMMGRKRMVLFTTIQIMCLIGLWCFKQNPATSIFFPSMIGLLMIIRSKILPKIFTEDELTVLGDPTPSKHLDDDL